MTHSNLRVEVRGDTIVVAMRGTCLRAQYRKQEAPWLATDGYGPDDPDASITFSEFRNLAWAAAKRRGAPAWLGEKFPRIAQDRTTDAAFATAAEVKAVAALRGSEGLREEL